MDRARRTLTRSLVVATIAAAFPLTAGAQSTAGYPSKSIRLVVPYAAGGFPDTVARIVAQRLQERVGQTVIVENRPGANGSVAASALLSAPADGYSFLVTDGSMFSINPKLYSKLTYDPTRDFVPVAIVARASLYLAVHPKLPVSTFKEFVDYARARPGQVNYGSSGIGSTHQLTMEALKSDLKLDMVHVPFKGTGQAVPALIGGQVDVLWSAYPSLAGFVKEGRVKLLANNAAQRSALAPDVPTIAETIPGFDFAPIVGVLAPVGTPKPMIDKIAAEIVAAARQPEAQGAMTAAGIDVVAAGPDEYAKAIADENARLAKAIQAAGLKAE